MKILKMFKNRVTLLLFLLSLFSISLHKQSISHLAYGNEYFVYNDGDSTPRDRNIVDE